MLNFPDLQSLLRFFTHGPGRPDLGYDLSHITYIRIFNLDHWSASPWDFSLQYANEAFELLAANLSRMRLQWLQLCVEGYASSSVDTPGIWGRLNLLPRFLPLTPAPA